MTDPLRRRHVIPRGPHHTFIKRPRYKQELAGLQEAFIPVQEHIKNKWEQLTCTHRSWFLGALEDGKIPEGKQPPYYLYISDKEDMVKVQDEVDKAYAELVDKIDKYEEDKRNGHPLGLEPVWRSDPTPPTPRESTADSPPTPEDIAPPLIIATKENILKPADIRIKRLERDPITQELKPPVERDTVTGEITKGKHGLLYLPYPYVVPGIRYNEMYDWDSAFVVRGLLHDKQFDKAKYLVDNMLYQIKNYGTILNGNRTYYLDAKRPRSQPPLLTAKIQAVYDNYDTLTDGTCIRGQDKITWLKEALAVAEKDHSFWLKEPHAIVTAEDREKASMLYDNLTDEEKTDRPGHILEKKEWLEVYTTNYVHNTAHLSKYDSNRTTPSDEVEFCEPGHYEVALTQLSDVYGRLKNKLGKDTITAILESPTLNAQLSESLDSLEPQERKDLYYIEQYLKLNDDKEPAGLSEAFYRGDWAMRESGFDPSRRFGFYNVDIINHIPVCLNSLRYKMEREITLLYKELVRDDPDNSALWQLKNTEWDAKSIATREAMQQLWDDGDGVREPAFRDRNTNNDLQKKYNLPEFRDYDYATALFPMWAGVTTQEQANKIANYICPKLISEHGLDTSTRKGTGSQWDWPIMWAPLQVAAMEGLERYGYYDEAWKIGTGFMNTVIKEFDKNGFLREKYQSKDGSAETAQFISMGYKTNDVGFAWTNSAATEIMASLPRLLEKIQGKVLTVPDIDTTGVVITKGDKYPPFMTLKGLEPVSSMSH